MHPEFEQATITAYPGADFRRRVRLAESRGWTLGTVHVADGLATAIVYRPFRLY